VGPVGVRRKERVDAGEFEERDAETQALHTQRSHLENQVMVHFWEEIRVKKV